MKSLQDVDILLKHVFEKYDKSKKGTLSVKEFSKILIRLSKHVPKLKLVEMKTIEEAFTIFDKDGDGLLNFEEFSNWWKTTDRYKFFIGEKGKLLRKAYKLYNQYSDQAGITHNNFSHMMEELGLEYTDHTFDSLDYDDDGILDFDEFCKWLNWF